MAGKISSIILISELVAVRYCIEHGNATFKNAFGSVPFDHMHCYQMYIFKRYTLWVFDIRVGPT